MRTRPLKILVTPNAFYGISPNELASALAQIGCRLEVTPEANTFRIVPNHAGLPSADPTTHPEKN